MSQNLAPPPSGPVRSKNRRLIGGWLSDQPETRSVQIAVVVTVLFHLILLLVLKHQSEMDRLHPPAPHRPRKPTVFNIQLLPPAPRPVAKPRPKYVEANPNAPENIPDKTNNVSDRNQQVAQEKPAKSKSDMPTTVGRKDIASQQIVTGDLSKPVMTPPTPPVTPPKPNPSQQTQRREQNPLAGIEKSSGTDQDGVASNVGKMRSNQTPVPQPVEGSKDGPVFSNFSTGTPQIDRFHPQARHTLELHVRPAVFADNKFGTPNIGLQALDSRWSNYGAYMRRLTETVQIEWDRILDSASMPPSSGDSVSVKFILNSKGEVSKILGVTPSEGTSDTAIQACVSGITARAPYGPWTDDMISVLGTEQELTFTFYYE